MIPEIGEEIFWCPSTSGFKSWRAMSYHPATEAFYIPITLNCETAVFGPVEKRPGGGGTGPVRRTNHLHPDSPEHLGEFLAMSVRTGEVLWRHRVRTPINSGALTTGGGLAIAGDWDRYLYVHDAADGEILWQTRAHLDSGVPDHLRGRWEAVPGRASRVGWWKLDVVNSVPADAREAPAGRRERDLRVRAARLACFASSRDGMGARDR